MTDSAATSAQLTVTSCLAGSIAGDKTDFVIEETPVEIRYNGQSYAVLMATPNHLAELAVGFSLSEDIIQQYDHIATLSVYEEGAGFVVDVGIQGAGGARLSASKRNLVGRTGCGLCGLEKLADLPSVRRLIRPRVPVQLAVIEKALRDFAQHQPLRGQTGASHGVAWVSLTGEIVAVFEDVGRHNALDKLIGWGARRRIDWATGWLLISSRASFEMVQKAANTRVGLIVALSAPTAHGVRLAQQYHLTLAGFARPGKMILYSYPERVTL